MASVSMRSADACSLATAARVSQYRPVASRRSGDHLSQHRQSRPPGLPAIPGLDVGLRRGPMREPDPVAVSAWTPARSVAGVDVDSGSDNRTSPRTRSAARPRGSILPGAEARTTSGLSAPIGSVSGTQAWSWICCHLGACEHYAVPRALHQAGRLGLLIADAWSQPGTIQGSITASISTRLRQRFHPTSPTRMSVPSRDPLLLEIQWRLQRLDGWDLPMAAQQMVPGRRFGDVAGDGGRLPPDRICA